MKTETTETRHFQPYFVAYAKSNGREPQAQLDHDKTEWPGGCMCGFMLWIGDRKTAFHKIQPEAFIGDYSIGNHEAWANFLEAVK